MLKKNHSKLSRFQFDEIFYTSFSQPFNAANIKVINLEIPF